MDNIVNIVLTERVYTIEEIKEMTCEIFEKYNIEEAYIFGSYARDEAKKDSDIDIIIKRDDLFSFLQLSSLANDLMLKLKKEIDLITDETYTEDIKYDEIDIQLVKERFYNKVKEERKKIYG